MSNSSPSIKAKDGLTLADLKYLIQTAEILELDTGSRLKVLVGFNGTVKEAWWIPPKK